jgi:hypothetical protein
MWKQTKEILGRVPPSEFLAKVPRLRYSDPESFALYFPARAHGAAEVLTAGNG